MLSCPIVLCWQVGIASRPLALSVPDGGAGGFLVLGAQLTRCVFLGCWGELLVSVGPIHLGG